MRWSMLVAGLGALFPITWSAPARGAVTGPPAPVSPSQVGDREARTGTGRLEGRLWGLMWDGYTIPLGLAMPPVPGRELGVGAAVPARPALD